VKHWRIELLITAFNDRSFVAQSNHELRNTTLGIDVYAHMLDLRRALGSAIQLFQLNVTANPQKLQVGSDQNLAPCRIAYTRTHGSTEALDMHADARAWRGPFTLDGPGLLGTTDRLEQLRPIGIEIGKANTEFATALLLTTPAHLPLSNNLAANPVEATHESLAWLRQISGTESNSVNRYIDRFSFEAPRRSCTNFHKRFVLDARRRGVPSVDALVALVALVHGHFAVLPDPFGRLAEKQGLWPRYGV